jgi:hypothetical protein
MVLGGKTKHKRQKVLSISPDVAKPMSNLRNFTPETFGAV